MTEKRTDRTSAASAKKKTPPPEKKSKSRWPISISITIGVPVITLGTILYSFLVSNDTPPPSPQPRCATSHIETVNGYPSFPGIELLPVITASGKIDSLTESITLYGRELNTKKWAYVAKATTLDHNAWKATITMSPTAGKLSAQLELLATSCEVPPITPFDRESLAVTVKQPKIVLHSSPPSGLKIAVSGELSNAPKGTKICLIGKNDNTGMREIANALPAIDGSWRTPQFDTRLHYIISKSLEAMVFATQEECSVNSAPIGATSLQSIGVPSPEANPYQNKKYMSRDKRTVNVELTGTSTNLFQDESIWARWTESSVAAIRNAANGTWLATIPLSRSHSREYMVQLVLSPSDPGDGGFLLGQPVRIVVP